MEPIYVAGIAAISGIVSGLVVSLVKPWGEDWQDRQKGWRTRRVDDLARLKDMLGQGSAKYPETYAEFRSLAAAVGDSGLISHVGRVITASTQKDKDDAIGDAMNRIGELRSEIK